MCPLPHRGCVPELDFYTTTDNLILKENCTERRDFGQVFNEDLDVPLPVDIELNETFQYRDTTKCRLLLHNSSVTHCWGKVMIQDYKPRELSFSLRFKCSDEWNPLNTFQGLKYNFSVSQTNLSECVKIPTGKYRTNCANYHKYTSLPNMLGVTNIGQFEKIVGELQMAQTFLKAGGHITNGVQDCHAYLEEILCFLLAPKCDPATKQIVHLCKEMCFEMMEACYEKVFDRYKIMTSQPGNLAIRKDLIEDGVLIKHTNSSCGYLPSRQSSTHTCFYRPVFCRTLPGTESNLVAKRVDISGNENRTYPARFTVDFSCASKKFQMKGNSTVTCLYSGKWSDSPECVVPVAGPVPIVLSVLAIPMIIFSFQ